MREEGGGPLDPHPLLLILFHTSLEPRHPERRRREGPASHAATPECGTSQLRSHAFDGLEKRGYHVSRLASSSDEASKARLQVPKHEHPGTGQVIVPPVGDGSSPETRWSSNGWPH